VRLECATYTRAAVWFAQNAAQSLYGRTVVCWAWSEDLVHHLGREVAEGVKPPPHVAARGVRVLVSQRRMVGVRQARVTA
jgi:hypothetical protein